MNRIICLAIFVAVGVHRICTSLEACTVFALSMSSQSRMDPSLTVRRELPDKILVGYATRCSEQVVKAVREGVNVVIWSFVEMMVEADESAASGVKAKCTHSFDVFCAKEIISQLDLEGYDDTVHLVSFGGWNGPHLPDELTAEDMYAAWKELTDGIFHGVDWDLEGHDGLENPTNNFSIQCLENMGRFSELAKQDGFLVGMAPPQSYLDIEQRRFTRFVNLTDPDRGWHDDFHYFGNNVYAYLLSKYGDFIDFVSIQFYESYSRAGLEVFHNHVPPETYLQNYVRDLVAHKEESFFVDFDQDPSLNHSSRMVSFPRSKLVFGFANGWGAKDDERVCYFDPKDIAVAYKALEESNQAPRGFMFWVM
jgi:beta-glucosidase